MKTYAVVLAMLAALSFTTTLVAEVPLVADGQPKAAIVLAEGVKANSPACAILLARLKEMSGATLPLITESEFGETQVEGRRLVAPAGKTMAESFILLGESALTRNLRVSLEGVGVGGIVVQTSGNALVLMGRSEGPDGARSDANQSAVCRFLESLGCRRLWPGPRGQITPRKATISVADLDVCYTPKVSQRAIRMMPRGDRNFDVGLAWLGFSEDDYKATIAKAQGDDSLRAWGAWNGLGGDLGLRGGHAGNGLKGGWQEHGKAHPEWFALQTDGTRDQSKAGDRWRICESNPELREHVANNILKRLDGRPQPPIPLCPNDGGYSSFCMCERCKALDPPNAPKITLMRMALLNTGLNCNELLQ